MRINSLNLFFRQVFWFAFCVIGLLINIEVSDLMIWQIFSSPSAIGKVFSFLGPGAKFAPSLIILVTFFVVTIINVNFEFSRRKSAAGWGAFIFLCLYIVICFPTFRSIVWLLIAFCALVGIATSLYLVSLIHISRCFSPLFRAVEWKKPVFIPVAISACLGIIASALVYYYGIRGVVLRNTICLVASWRLFMVTLRQPLTFRERQRIWVYLAQKDDPAIKSQQKQAMLAGIKDHFCEPYDYRFGVELIQAIIRLVLPTKVVGKENVDPTAGPAIFVCNHGQEVGPIMAVTLIPTFATPWIDDRMCEWNLILNHMWNGTFKNMFKNEKFGRWITRPIFHFVHWSMNAFRPVHVYRDNIRGSMVTLNNSAAEMMKGNNLLVFPEDHSKNEGDVYLDGSVGAFFTGFVHIGKIYGELSGRPTVFYPVAISKKKHTFTIGKPLVFDNTKPLSEEKKHIAEELQKTMNSMM